MKWTKETITGTLVIVGFISFMAALFVFNDTSQKNNVQQNIVKNKNTSNDEIMDEIEKHLNIGFANQAQSKLNKIIPTNLTLEQSHRYKFLRANIDSVIDQEQMLSIMQKVDNSRESLRKFNTARIFKVKDVIKKTGEFGSYVQSVHLGRRYNQEMKDYTTELASEIESAQLKYFPILREKYAEIAQQMLWVDDIDVNILGRRSDRIQFIGGAFAANRNIKSTYEGLQSVLKRLRFKRADFKWIPSETKYTYYSIPSPKDSELIGY